MLSGWLEICIALVCRSNKRPPAKAKKSPVGNWLSFFHLGKSQSVSKRKLKRHPSEPNEIKSIALPGDPPPPQLSKLFFFLSDSLNYHECLSYQQLVAVQKKYNRVLTNCAGGRGDTGTLRSTKSEESLTSLHNLEGDYAFSLYASPLQRAPFSNLTLI